MAGIKTHLENQLGRHAPRLYIVLQRWVRTLKRRFGRMSYAESRRHYNYYREVVRLAQSRLSQGDRVIDVGSGEATVIGDLEGCGKRVTLDQRWIPSQPGVEHITADFISWRPDADYDLVVCLQVLEHLDEPATFTRKLFDTGRTVIISVPYRWPSGYCAGHVQDPVDEDKLRRWTGREPDELLIVQDRMKRLIAVYEPQADAD
jgi:hypothetical protein